MGDRKERIKDEEQLNAKEDDVIMRIKIPTTKKLTTTISNDRGKTLSTSSSSSNSSSMIDSKSKSRNSLEIENRNNTNDTISIDDHYNTMESPGSGESSKHVLSTTLLTMPEQSPTIIEKEKVITKNNSGGRSGSGDMISPNLLNSKETKIILNNKEVDTWMIKTKTMKTKMTSSPTATTTTIPTKTSTIQQEQMII